MMILTLKGSYDQNQNVGFCIRAKRNEKWRNDGEERRHEKRSPKSLISFQNDWEKYPVRASEQ